MKDKLEELFDEKLERKIHNGLKEMIDVMYQVYNQNP